LLGAYLAARGYSGVLTSDLRAANWLAGASNAFAGALRFHLHVAQHAESREQRGLAAHAASDWLRIVRRADAYVS
jgi:hypothetical protein